MARKTIPGSPGLWTAPNSESAPPGSLSVAKNVVIRRDGLIGKPRPMRQYSLASDMPAAMIAQMSAGFWNNLFLVWDSLGHLSVETGPGSKIFTQATDAVYGNANYINTGNDPILRSTQASSNFYINTNTGVLKYDGTAFMPSGVPRALDVQLSLVAAGTLLANTNSVAYRVVYGILDGNKNLIVGAPSGRSVVTGTAAQNVTVKSWIPNNIKSATNGTSYFYQVFRTAVQTIASTDPGDEMQLVYQNYLTSANISAGFVSVTDALADNMRGTSLYTNPSQEGIAAANYQPPVCTDLALFKGTTFFSCTVEKNRSRIQMLGVAANILTISTGAGGITKSGGNGIITLTGSPDLTGLDSTCYVSITASTSAANNGEFPIVSVDNGAKTITYTNAGAVTEPGTASSRAFPSRLTIAGTGFYGSLNGTETPGSGLYSVVTSNGTVSQNVRDTCASLLRVVNQGQSAVNGYYESGPEDAAGRMLFEEVTINTTTPSIAALGTLWSTSFAPVPPIGTAAPSVTGRLYFSKTFQPEHVPLGNYIDIGSSADPILRIIPLREALLVFKNEGLYRVTSDGAGNLAVSLSDSSVSLISQLSLTTLSNAIYAITTRGFLRVTEQSVVELGRQVRDLISASIETATSSYTPTRRTTYTPSPLLYASHIDQMVTITNVRIDSAGTAVSLCYSIPTNAWTQVYQESANRYAGLGSVLANGVRYDFSEKHGMREDLFHGNQPASLGADATREPVPIHKPLVNITAVNAGASQVTVTSTTLDGPYGALVVGGLVEANLPASQITTYARPLYQITAINSLVLTLALAYGTSSGFANDFATGRCNVYDDNPANDARYAVSLQWLPYGGGDIGEATRFSEFAVLLDPMSTTTLQSGSSITVAASTDGAAKANMSVFTPANTPAPPATPMTQTLLRSLIPPAAQKARAMIGYLTTALCPRSFFYLLGISYEYEPTDGHETT